MVRCAALVILLIAACTPTSVEPRATPSSAAAPGVTTASATSAGGAPTAPAAPAAASSAVTMREFVVPAGSGPHDVAPAADGGVWFTAQRSGQLGWLDPRTGRTRMIRLGTGSAPHGVIVDRDGVAWVTDGGQNAIVSVDPHSNDTVTVFKLPGPSVDLNTAVFDAGGVLWFTGQGGYFGRLDPRAAAPAPQVFAAPRGTGPYGITYSIRGGVYYASLAGSHIAHVVGEGAAFRAEPIDPPTPRQGARRVWSDSKGAIWVSEWNAGQVARYDAATGWKEWKLPGARPQAYAVFVDDRDIVWLSEWSASAIVRFDPATERFDVFPYASGGNVRQLHGRAGEVWGALSALDKLIVLTTR